MRPNPGLKRRQIFRSIRSDFIPHTYVCLIRTLWSFLFTFFFRAVKATGAERQDGFGVLFIETSSAHGQVRVALTTANESMQHDSGGWGRGFKIKIEKNSSVFFQGESIQYIIEDQEELQKAEEMVRFQLRHGNDLLAQDSLRDCDVNVKEQGRLLRQNEFLVWQGKTGKKSLRQVFLFEELVLFSKARRFPDRKVLPLLLIFVKMLTCLLSFRT